MSRNAEWWRTFFEGPFGDLQVRRAHHHSTDQDVARVARRLGAFPARILDAPCGAGRHSLALARQGHSVVGIDFNPHVLEVATATASEQGLDAEFRLGDLRALALDEQFDAVLCLWTSIGYFSDRENEAALRALAAALKPGGPLFLDTQVLESALPRFRERQWSWWGEGDQRIRVSEDVTWNYAQSRMEGHWYFDGPDRHEVRPFSLRIYSCRELLGMLGDAGLNDFRCLGDGDEEFRLGASRLWLEATKLEPARL